MTQQSTLPSSDQLPQNFTRRDILVGLLASVGAMSTAGCVERLENDLSRQAVETNKPDGSHGFYTDSEFALIQRLSDLIIPTTDTPGAIEVGVPKLMDQLYVEWASASSKKKHREAIASIAKALDSIAEEDFIIASPETQLSALTKLDSQAFSTQWSKNSQYRSVKDLIAKCYYTTEPGATQELRYERVPGKWEPCVPLEQVGRTWYK